MQKSEMFHERIYVLFLGIKNSMLNGYILGKSFKKNYKDFNRLE